MVFWVSYYSWQLRSCISQSSKNLSVLDIPFPGVWLPWQVNGFRSLRKRSEDVFIIKTCVALPDQEDLASSSVSSF